MNGSGVVELEEEVDVEPVLLLPSPTQAPDHVAVALAEVIADVAVADPLQSAEVEVLDPPLADETAEELFDHLGV
jgi:hypothetical protein